MMRGMFSATEVRMADRRPATVSKVGELARPSSITAVSTPRGRSRVVVTRSSSPVAGIGAQNHRLPQSGRRTVSSALARLGNGRLKTDQANSLFLIYGVLAVPGRLVPTGTKIEGR
jgi:hypothetical protein